MNSEPDGNLPAEPPTIPRRRLPAIIDAHTLCQRHSPLPTELIRGILHQGSKLSFGGASKGFKTWTLDAMALSVAYGLPWLGFETQMAKVLLIDLELQEAFCRRRIVKLEECMRIDSKPGMLDIWSLRGFAVCHSEMVPMIEERITEGNYGLIIIDPIYKLYSAGASENAAADIAGLMNALERLAVASNAAIAFAAHYSKGNQAGKSSIDRVSGSGVFARDPDSLLSLTAHEETDCYTLEATLRNFPPAEPVVLKWKHPMFERIDHLNPQSLEGKKSRGRKSKYNPEILLSTLQDGMTSIEWRIASGMAQHTFEKHRNKLIEDERVQSSNHKWILLHRE
jgi:RecA-family ATPase